MGSPNQAPTDRLRFSSKHIPLDSDHMSNSDCLYHFRNSAGGTSSVDVDAAEPADFIEPFSNGTLLTGTSPAIPWIFFKGDPASGPTQGHPFVMPFNNSALFSLDLLDAADTSQEIFAAMRKFSRPFLGF